MILRLPSLLRAGAASLLAVSTLAGTGTGAGDLDSFERRIRPFLAENCFDCHGPDKQKAGLRIDSREALLAGGESGPAIVPGQPDRSRLILALRHADPELAMPPKKPRLPEDRIREVAQWIANGAPWPSNGSTDATASPTSASPGFNLEARRERLPWIWSAPTRQPVPAVAGPAPASDVDRFIRARLEKLHLSPAPPVDDLTWFRRASFTLTGLPPTPAEIRTFLGHPATERRGLAVDRLLASPHFGERWARHWLDLVRYAETRGHEFDYAIANAWQYRDYVVRAFNADLPYDRFVAEHVAGDLLPPRLNPANRANESILATGWAFLGEEAHSPVDIRLDECERIDNKVDVLSKAFLGLTVACARCHDHKFDAITQADYYALSGFITSSSYRQVRFESMAAHEQASLDLARIRAKHQPTLANAIATLFRPALADVAHDLLTAPRSTNTAGSHPGSIQAWARELSRAALDPTHPLRLFASLPTNAATLPPDSFRTAFQLASQPSQPARSLPTGSRIIADFSQPDRTPWKVDGPAFGTGPVPAGSLLLDPSSTNSPLRITAFTAASSDPFWNRLRLAPGNEPDGGGLGAHHRTGRTLRTPRTDLVSGRIHYLMRGRARVYAAVDAHIMLAGPLHGRLVTTLDAGPTASWVSHDLTPYAGHRAHFEFSPDGEHPLDVLQVVEAPEKPSTTAVPPWTPQSVPTDPTHLARAFQSDLGLALDALAAGNLGQQPRLAPLAAWLLANPDLLGLNLSAAPVAPLLATAADDLRQLSDTIPWVSATAPALFDGTGCDEPVLLRGKPTRPSQPAPRSLPVAMGFKPIRSEATSGRLNLARQLTDAANPLLARVFVNRVWQHLFGRGIVGTPDNFGFLGERPTHPELLDHLAFQFIHEDRWSVKSLVRRLVLSDTFAMGPTPSSQALEADPSNRLWHHIPVRRLEAEAIRDAILTVSGRLDPAIGGPPVPIFLTPFHEGRGRPEKSGPLDGNGRRSLYGAVRRNFMPTMLVAFDFPTPFSTIGRRNRTNVPAQSLVLRNDPFIHEQARVWAERTLREVPGGTDDDRVSRLFESAFARPPATHERVSCQESLAQLRTLHAAGDEAAVWADLCHALLNTNDFLFLQ